MINALVAGAICQLPDVLIRLVHTRLVRASAGGRSQSFRPKTNRQITPVTQPIKVLAKRETKLGQATRTSRSEITMKEMMAQTGLLSPRPRKITPENQCAQEHIGGITQAWGMA